jgi:TetR/AcrR family transcriptional regulator, transcriptional repressor for nem operon
MVAREKTEQLRQQVIEAADKLFYQKGYNLTSFSDIAKVSKVPRGNLNYYFSTKDEVLIAVVRYRVSEMQKMLRNWESEYKTPLERLQRYAQIVSKVKEEVIHYGCPMGTLNSELGKSQQALQTITKEQFEVFEKWIKKQFKDMGCSKSAAELTMHLMVRTQGIATMAYIHQDERLIKREVRLIGDWLESLDG